MSKPLGRKQRIILETLAPDAWTPGPVLADKIGVPKHIVWPYIERLRDRGYQIEGEGTGTAKRGYRLRA